MLYIILHLAFFILFNQSFSPMSLSSLQKWHFNDYMAFHCLVVQNLCSQFSICRHRGSLLVFMIINDAAMNILVQEIFIWVSDNVPRRNPQPGNYGVSALLFATSRLTDALEKWVAPVTPWTGSLYYHLSDRDGIMRIFFSCRGEMQTSPPGSLRRLHTWTHSMQSIASPAGIIS